MKKRIKVKEARRKGRKPAAAKRLGVAVAPGTLAIVHRLQKRLSIKAGKRVSLSNTISEATKLALKR